jgi:hypothetical protein
MSAKEITSLLFYSVGSPDISLPHIVRLKQELARKRFNHALPELAEHEFPDKQIKWMFDFSDQLDAEPYDDALSTFLESHEQFILDVLSVDPGVTYYLSAQLSIDGRLAAFEIKVPRIPNKINSTRSFQFSYFVWHVSSEDERAERNAAGTLQ